MSNFSGNVRKNANSFKHKSSSGGVRYAGVGKPVDDAGVGRVVGGVYAGQDAVTVFEKANQPVLVTTPTPRTDGRGESELGLSGQVDHPNNDGQAVYAAAQIAREYRQLVAPVGGIENLSIEQRRQMRDELVRRVGATEDGAQQPEGDSASAQATRQYVREVASLLFGLIDELSETPDFLRAPKPPTPDSDRVGRIGTDYLKPVHKSVSGYVQVDCPRCRAANVVESNNFNGALQKVTCSSCGKPWEQDLSFGTFIKSAPANPELAAVKKQLAILTERLRGIIAARAGVVSTGSSGSGRFVSLGTGEVRNRDAAAREAMTKSLANGVNLDKLVRG